MSSSYSHDLSHVKARMKTLHDPHSSLQIVSIKPDQSKGLFKFWGHFFLCEHSIIKLKDQIKQLLRADSGQITIIMSCHLL